MASFQQEKINIQYQDDLTLLPLRVSKEAGVVVDLEIQLTEAQYSDFRKHFPLEQLGYQNSCYTMLLQNQLAKFKAKQWSHPINKKSQEIGAIMDYLQELSELFIPLEALINRASLSNPQQDLASLLEVLHAFRSELSVKVKALVQGEAYKESILARISLAYEVFLAQVEAIKKNNPTDEITRELFSLQAFSYNKASLGGFICDQLCCITQLGNIELDRLLAEPFLQLLYMHPAKKVLSDAKAGLAKKGKSLYGVRYNNTRSPVPKEMIKRMSQQSSGSTKWLSLKPYLRRLDEVEKIEDMICFFADSQSVRKKRGIKAHYKLAAIFSGMLELFIYVPIHLVLSVLCVFIPNKALRQWLSDGLYRLHHNFSLLRLVRKRANYHYSSRSEVTRNKLQAWQGDSRSLFNELIRAYLSAEVIYSYLANGMKKIFISVRNIIWQDGVRWLAFTGFNNEVLKRQILVKMQSKLNEEQAKFHAQFDEVLVQREEECKASDECDRYVPVEFWQANEFNSPLDFLDEILVGLSDVIVDPMFRKSPGLATFFFMMSVTSLSMLFLPAMATNKLGVFGKVLEDIPVWFSKKFTGKEVSEGISEKIVAVFLEWKSLFFTSEVVMESLQGDFDFLDSLFGEAEKIILGLWLLIGVGFGLQYIPHLSMTEKVSGNKMTNPVIPVVNFFTDESRNCRDGQFPLTGIEYAFLGLKSILLLHSLVSESGQSVKSGVGPSEVARQVIQSVRGSQGGNAGGAHQCDERLAALAVSYSIPLSVIEKLKNKLGQMPKIPPGQGGEDKTKLKAKSAKDKLIKELNFIAKIDFYQLTFDSKFNAKRYYDYLDELFTLYNKEAGIKIKQQEFLSVFFNKYCYSGSTNGIKLLALALYPLTCLWRLVKYVLATKTSRFYSPAIAHQVVKSFNKELCLLIQLIAIVGRVMQALARSLRNLFQLRVHKIDLLFFFHGVYARSARVAGTLSDVRTELVRLSDHFFIRPVSQEVGSSEAPLFLASNVCH